MSAQRSRFLFACIALDINFQPHIRHWVSCPYILVPNNACNLRRKCVHLKLLEETLMLGRLRARGEGGDTGWDGWMASPTWWTWVWASSGSWWWTGRPGVLQSMGSQRVGHDWSMCMPTPVSQFIPPLPTPIPLVTRHLFSMPVTLFLFGKRVHVYHLDSTYKWYHMTFVFLSDIAWCDHLWVHLCSFKWHYFIFVAEWYPIVYT